MLDDPQARLSQLCVQAEEVAELAESDRLKTAGSKTFDETGATCCYAHSDKTWVEEPPGIRWETFHTFARPSTMARTAPPSQFRKPTPPRLQPPEARHEPSVRHPLPE
jgi:hypothetical protein